MTTPADFPPPLLCAVCLYTREDARTADTVIAGTAVCEDHLGYLHDGAMREAVAMVKGAKA